MKKAMMATMGMAIMALVAMLPMRATAADFEVQNVFEDSVYGAGIGALVGLGFMLISSKPTDHWNYPVVGAGVGLIAGAAYGTYSGARSMASYEDGKLKLAMPTPQVRQQNQGAHAHLALAADLFSSRF